MRRALDGRRAICRGGPLDRCVLVAVVAVFVVFFFVVVGFLPLAFFTLAFVAARDLAEDPAFPEARAPFAAALGFLGAARALGAAGLGAEGASVLSGSPLMNLFGAFRATPVWERVSTTMFAY